MPDELNDPKAQLREAWDDMICALQDARDAIDHIELMPAPESDRNLAEGYRYLMGFVHSAVERAFHSDPVRPQFRNALSVITRSTIDNADAIYFYAPLDGRQTYRLHAEVADSSRWRNEEPPCDVPLAPHYLIFEASWGGMAGDSGNLGELRPGMKTQTGRLDSSVIELNPDGSFDILLAPERPQGYEGNFISTLKVVSRPHPVNPEIPAPRYANFISGRQLFNDWSREEAIHFEIVQLGSEGTAPQPYNAATAARQIRQLGDLVRNQIHFWNAFWTIPMGTYGERKGTLPGVGFPRNAFNKINAASAATGGGMSTNLYAGGVFELAAGEALVIENRIELAPQYTSIQLSNLWGESADYANRLGSLNGQQMLPDVDGIIRIVIAHTDPGVHNWLDSSGLPEGFMAVRWAYSETPEESQWPAITAQKIEFEKLCEYLPEETIRVSPQQRREQIAVRQRHVQKRFRSF